MNVTHRSGPLGTHDHARHDELLVAAHAAGDLTERDAETAAGWVEECATCRRLAADLTAIQAATAALPAPRRTADFRLTDDDARRLRGGGARAVLRWFASPRLSFAAPLGSALATLGIVGLLVGTSTFGIGVGAAGSLSAPTTVGAPAGGANTDVAASAPEVMSAQSASGPAQTPALRSAASPSVGVAAAPSGASADVVAPVTSADGPAVEAAPAADRALPAEEGRGEANPLIVASGVVLVLGLLLVALRVGGRRSTAAGLRGGGRAR